MNKVNISHVDNMHNQWLRTLNFYKTEIAIHKGILTEIAGKNTGNEVMRQVEHFENQFKIQNYNIDVLLHEIHSNVSNIAKQAAASSAGYIDGLLLEEHRALGAKTEAQEKVSSDLVHEFRRFAERMM
jgi:hypothetical protein